MKLSSRFRFGVRIMLHMALTEPGKPLLARQLAAEQGITPKYTDQLLFALRTGNLLVSQRGRSGGFLLARPPAKITVFEIFEVLEGTVALADSIDRSGRSGREIDHVTHQVWTTLAKTMRKALQEITLAGLVDMQRQQLKTVDYSI